MTLDVKHIAQLAKLDIPDEKLEKLTEEMSAIVQMVEKLPPLESTDTLLDEDDTMILRPDMARPSLPREAILHNAPEVADGCFVAPKTLE